MWALVISATAAARFTPYVCDFLMPWLDCFEQIGLDNQICLERASPTRCRQPVAWVWVSFHVFVCLFVLVWLLFGWLVFLTPYG